MAEHTESICTNAFHHVRLDLQRKLKKLKTLHHIFLKSHLYLLSTLVQSLETDEHDCLNLFLGLNSRVGTHILLESLRIQSLFSSRTYSVLWLSHFTLRQLDLWK